MLRDRLRQMNYSGSVQTQDTSIQKKIVVLTLLDRVVVPGKIIPSTAWLDERVNACTCALMEDLPCCM